MAYATRRTTLSSDDPAAAPRPVGPYTPVVAAGGWLVCSGQLALLDGQLVSGGVEAQVAQCVANLDALLQEHGATLGDVVKTTVLLADIGDYPAMNRAYTAAFGDHRPARAAFAVAALPLDALVEIEAWAYVGS